MTYHCPFDPSSMLDMPIGMFHCPKCGEMVVAGIPHPRWDLLDDILSNDELNFIRGEEGEGDGVSKEDDPSGKDRTLGGNDPYSTGTPDNIQHR